MHLFMVQALFSWKQALLMETKVVILGIRGSAPVSGEAYLRYGGATTCVFLRFGDQIIVLDCGTGMMELPKVLQKDDRQITVLLSHPHVDHLLGLPMCPVVFDPEKKIDMYGALRNGMDVRQQVCAFLAPPLWPVGPDRFPAKISFHDLPDAFCLGDVTVETMDGFHPGGVSLFRITGGGKSIVYMTDCTVTEKNLPKLADFARDCDLLLCDGQYSPQEWPDRKHFGHSTWTAAAQLGAQCGAKMVRIIHHDPFRTDTQLDCAEKEVTAIHRNCIFARAGEEILL